MKNESPFILEWIAYHRIVGFKSIVIASNDCEDGTDRLLDALALEGVISHRRNFVAADQDPQWVFLSELNDHPSYRRAEWVLALDADEMLRIDVGSGHVEDLIAVSPSADAIVVLWKTFGDSNIKFWDGGLVLEQFTRCEAKIDEWNRCHKTLFRNCAKFDGIDAHYPMLAQSADLDDVKVCNARGEFYEKDFFFGDETRLSGLRTDKSRWTWENVRVNHYPYKTPDLFALKRYRGDNVPGRGPSKYDNKSPYAWLGRKNDAVDDSASRWLPALRQEMELLRESRRIREAETAALADFAALRDRVLAGERAAVADQVSGGRA
jgi:hypothetical protein